MTMDALGSAVSGLRVTQRALDVVSSNISNATTPGYTRKLLPQEALVTDGNVVGVRYGEIQRQIDASLLRDYRTQIGVESYYSTKQSYLTRLVATQSGTDKEMNIGARVGQLYDSFIALSSTPNSTTAQSKTVEAADTLAKSLNTYSAELLNMRNEVQQKLSAEIDTLNAALKQIAQLNKNIQGLLNVGRSTAALEDQRDMLVKDVAKQLDISYYVDGDGTMVLQTKAGHVLADTEARELEVDRSTLTYSMAYPESMSGLIIKGTRSLGDIDLTKTSPGGSIGALLNLRDEELPSYIAQVDELAYKMMVRFDDQGVRVFTNKNGTIPVNDPAQYAGIAADIKVNDYIVQDPSLLQRGTSGPPVNPGSNDVIMKIINYTFGRFKDAAGTPNEPFLTTSQGYTRDISFNIIGDPNVSLSEYANAMLDALAGDLNENKATLETEQQYMQEVEKRVLDSSAVNSDEEMASLIQLQKAYSANAKIINALDGLFRDLLNAI